MTSNGAYYIQPINNTRNVRTFNMSMNPVPS